MRALDISIAFLWIVFWVYWLITAASAKEGTRSRRTRPPGLLIAVLVIVVLRVFKTASFTVHSPELRVLGAVLFLAGLGLAVWARVHLGRNWGMPMTEKSEPELVTSGPYRFLRHPIYSGILLATIGTALAVTLYWLAVSVVMGGYFVYSARIEEQSMVASFPSAYPSYRARTKMLIPFIL